MKNFGSEIKKNRKRLDLSMQALADKAGISKAMICKIEKGDSQPTLELACKLARALHTNINHLIYEDETDSVIYMKAADQPVWVDQSSKIVRRSLSPSFADANTELLKIILPANSEGLNVANNMDESSATRKYIYILRGELMMTVDNETYHLKTGDSLYYEAGLTHSFHNPCNTDSEYLLVVSLNN